MKPEGQTMSMANFKMSQASRDYSAESKDLEIEIIDGGYIPMVYQGFLMAMNYEIDSSDEYVKKITIKDYPGIEKYTYDDEDGEVILLIKDRFLVNLRCDNVPDTEEAKAIAETSRSGWDRRPGKIDLFAPSSRALISCSNYISLLGKKTSLIITMRSEGGRNERNGSRIHRDLLVGPGRMRECGIGGRFS